MDKSCFMFKFGEVMPSRTGRAGPTWTWQPESMAQRAWQGVVYATDSPACEVTFWDADDKPFDFMIGEGEVSATGYTSPVFERPLFGPELVKSAA